MKKIVTNKKLGRRGEKEVVAPSENTLDFIKMFARTYYVDKNIVDPINNVCIN